MVEAAHGEELDGNVGVRRAHRPAARPAAGRGGAALAFLALTTVQAVGVNPYLPPDELYHMGYALVVRDGRLPELTTQVPQDEVPLLVPDHGNRRIYTVNHPPLYYLPVSLALLVALGLGQGGFWLLARTGEPSGEPDTSVDETEPEPEPRADLHA